MQYYGTTLLLNLGSNFLVLKPFILFLEMKYNRDPIIGNTKIKAIHNHCKLELSPVEDIISLKAQIHRMEVNTNKTITIILIYII